jgi:hypothetical protein
MAINQVWGKLGIRKPNLEFIIVLTLFIVLGSIYIAISRANSAFMTAEAEAGALNGAALVTDASASGGQAVRFSGPTTFSLNDSATGTGLNQFAFTGSWNPDVDAPAYLSDEHWTLSAGAYYQVQFNGTQIKIFTTVDKTGGIMAVSIDGGTESMVDTYASARANQVLVYTSPTLASGLHTLKVRVTGTKNTAATNVGVVADRVDITGVAPTPPPPPTPNPNGPSPAIARGFMTAKLGQVTNTMLSDMKNVWGANVIRLQMAPRDMANSMGKPLSEAWPSILATLDDTVARANAAGLKVVVDMHQAPFPTAISERSTQLWSHPDLEKNFVDAWAQIATKLKPRSAGIWGFDLFNEPEIAGQSTAPSTWRPLATKLTSTIHGIAPDIWIVWDPGPNGQAHGYINLTPLPDNKVIYTAHDYRPHDFTHQCLPGWACPANYPYNGYDKTDRLNQLKPIRDFQVKYNVPIYIGEFSVIRNAPAADGVLWLQEAVDIYENWGWSWAYHAFREWDGWSLEHDNNLNNRTPVSGFTDRGLVIREVMLKNNQ